MADNNIVPQSPTALRPRATNPRTHSKKQIRQIAASIERFGFTNPVLVDRDGGIVAGHGRVEAARLLGLETVPTIRLDQLSEAEIRAYVIADNRLAELAGWDKNLLALELQGLIDLEFDVGVIGFESAEVDILIDELNVDNAADADDDVPAPSEGPAVSRR
jgi:ParB-like chromosome segregation protein Spo0J